MSRSGNPPPDACTTGLGRARAGFIGLVAAATGLGAAELTAGLVSAAPSLLRGVGDTVINTIPGWLSRAAIDAFGHHDKTALIAGTVLIAAALGVGFGMLARRHFAVGAAGFVAFTALGVAATASRPQTSVIGAIVVGMVGATVAVVTLWTLLTLGQATNAPASDDRASTDLHPATNSRRTFLLSAGGALVVGVLAGVGGWVSSGRERVNEIRRTIRLPRPFKRAEPIPAGADLDIAGLTPLFVPNRDFYRIDTALVAPSVDPTSWTLDLRGDVDRPYSLTYDELLALPQIEADVTLSCVSNEVGGNLVGNARWQGVRLADLLERARPRNTTGQLIGHSVDGFTAGFPTTLALHTTNAIVAVGMNGVPLPIEHGFPARLVVPGLYGYVSATKWLAAIELTGWDTDGYWIQRGWSKKGPIKTQTRIDVPTTGRSVRAGPVVIAGVAWAPTRGIERVEVKIDDGPWRAADLAPALGVDSWRQWHLRWDATPGTHLVTARATDGTGTTQTDVIAPPAPDGASGDPSRQITVQP